MYAISSYGYIYNTLTMKYLNPWKGKNGYLYVSLMADDNSVVKVGMHVLVALHFIEIPECLLRLNKPLVPNHMDFNKENNKVSNLQWMTYAMNNYYNFINGHCKVGEDAPNSKVSNETVHMICKLMEDGFSNKDIRKILNFENNKYYKGLITSIRNGTHWKSISSLYNITIKNTLRHNSEEYIESICKLIANNYSLSEMRKILNIPDTYEEKDKFKKLVWFIRKRKCYKDISSKYEW